jgi:hypothetical protein
MSLKSHFIATRFGLTRPSSGNCSPINPPHCTKSYVCSSYAIAYRCWGELNQSLYRYVIIITVHRIFSKNDQRKISRTELSKMILVRSVRCSYSYLPGYPKDNNDIKVNFSSLMEKKVARHKGKGY